MRDLHWVPPRRRLLAVRLDRTTRVWSLHEEDGSRVTDDTGEPYGWERFTEAYDAMDPLEQWHPLPEYLAQSRVKADRSPEADE